jgi:hypothetical protein
MSMETRPRCVLSLPQTSTGVPLGAWRGCQIGVPAGNHADRCARGGGSLRRNPRSRWVSDRAPRSNSLRKGHRRRQAEHFRSVVWKREEP